MSKFENLEGQKPAALRDLAKELKIIGRYQMDKAALIEAINATLAEKIAPKTDAPKPAATDPVSIAKKKVIRCRKKLVDERKSMLKATKEFDVATAKNRVKAAENLLRIAKMQLKEIKKSLKEKPEGFSWKKLAGWSALLITSAGIGVGAAMVLDKTNGEEAENGDSL